MFVVSRVRMILISIFEIFYIFYENSSLIVTFFFALIRDFATLRPEEDVTATFHLGNFYRSKFSGTRCLLTNFRFKELLRRFPLPPLLLANSEEEYGNIDRIKAIGVCEGSAANHKGIVRCWDPAWVYTSLGFGARILT